MKWNYWVISNSNKTVLPPKEWSDILEVLHQYKLIDKKIINKIEVAAFTIRGSRTLRWLLDKTDSQFATEHNSLEVAKKLLANYLELFDFAKKTPEELKIILNDYFNGEATKCTLCMEELRKEQFFLDGRKEQNAINMGHIEPLNQRNPDNSNHYAKNVGWQHRRCNYMQGERNIETALNHMYEILKRHGKI